MGFCLVVSSQCLMTGGCDGSCTETFPDGCWRWMAVCAFDYWPKGRKDHQGIQSNYKLLGKLLPRTRGLPTSWRSFWFCNQSVKGSITFCLMVTMGDKGPQQEKAHNYFDQLSTLIIRPKKITLISLFIILSFPANIYEFGKFQTHFWSKKDPHLSHWISNELELWYVQTHDSTNEKKNDI